MQAHLGAYALERSSDEMAGAHTPQLQGAERVLRRLSPHPHDFGLTIEPILYRLKNRLVLPARDRADSDVGTLPVAFRLSQAP